MKKITLFTAMLLSVMPLLHAQCNDNAVLPYLENFDNALPPDLPDCTYSYRQTFVGSDWECVTAPNNGFTGNVGRYSTYSDVGWSMYCDYILRPVPLTAGIAYKVSYKYAHDDNETAIDVFKLALYSNGVPTEIELASHSGITGTEVVNHSTEAFTVPVTANYYLRFSIESSGNQGILYLDDIKIEETGVMATADNKAISLDCYPNPVKDVLTITNTTSRDKLLLYNMAGQLLLAQAASETATTLNFENIPAGIYLLKAASERGSKATHLIKQ
ncbi:T9SS type A sorting domain-containing protein [Flavobacterium hauense]